MVLAIAFACNLAIFGYALQRQFVRPTGVAVPMRLLSVSGLLCAIGDVWLMLAGDSLPVLRLGVGLAFCLAGLWLFRAASKATASARLALAFSTDAPGHVNRTGPYRRIRHPYYVAYSLTWMGAAVALVQWPGWVPVIVMGAFYVYAARLEETKFLNSPLAGQYREYMQQAGMFFPRLTSGHSEITHATH